MVKREYTLREMCKIMKVKLPSEFNDVADIKRDSITLRKNEIVKGTVFFAGYDVVTEKSFYDDLAKSGAEIIFIDRNDYDEYEPNPELPFIIVDNLMEKQGRFFYHVKKQYKIKKTVAITGSVGKTTTTQLLDAITKNEMNSYCSKGNFNSYPSVANHIINELSENLDLYIQEIGAAAPTTVEKSAAMIHPNAYILTNVLPHHLNFYKTIENVFLDKTSISKYLRHSGVIITNFDDEMIANHRFPHKVISFGINTEKKVNYRAQNIEQVGRYLELDIIYKNNKIHLKVNVVGKHNAYNVLAAFAMAKYLGIDDETIKKNILNFKTKGIRQNIINIGNSLFYIDCYNVCNASIKAGVEAIKNMKVEKGCKKIAILGGENKLGKDYYQITYDLGKEIKDNDFDYIFCYSLANDTQKQIDYYGDSKPLYQSLIDQGANNVYLITDQKELIKKMKETIKPGDLVLVKANAELDITVAIDKLYGTSLTMNYEYKHDRNKVISNNDFEMKVNEDFNAGVIIKFNGIISEKLIIPDKINEYNVFKIARALFRKNENIKQIDFGKSLVNIGFAAFAWCQGLTELDIPSNVKWISDSAFAECHNIEKIRLNEGVINIGKNAFYNNKSLKIIYIPDSVKYIDENAFAKTYDFTIVCNKDSYAEKYSRQNNIKTKES